MGLLTNAMASKRRLPDQQPHFPQLAHMKPEEGARVPYTSRAAKATASFKAYDGILQLIADAAQAQHISAASYMRRLVVQDAARIMRVAPPEYASLERGEDVIKKAAQALGMTVAEFSKRAAEDAALRELSAPQSPPTPLKPKRR